MRKNASNQIRILFYGLDTATPHLGALNLSDHGHCEIDLVTNEYQLNSFLGKSSRPYDLIILCSDIPSSDKRRICESESRHSTVPVYMMDEFDAGEALFEHVAAWLIGTNVQGKISRRLLNWSKRNPSSSTLSRAAGLLNGLIAKSEA